MVKRKEIPHAIHYLVAKGLYFGLKHVKMWKSNELIQGFSSSYLAKFLIDSDLLFPFYNSHFYFLFGPDTFALCNFFQNYIDYGTFLDVRYKTIFTNPLSNIELTIKCLSIGKLLSHSIKGQFQTYKYAAVWGTDWSICQS